MCGILAAFGCSGTADEVRRLALKCTRKLRHRGPDANRIYQTPDGRNFMAHERLNIVDASDRGRFASRKAAAAFAQYRARKQSTHVDVLCRQPFKIKKESGDIVWMMCAALACLRLSPRAHDRDPPHRPVKALRPLLPR